MGREQNVHRDFRSALLQVSSGLILLLLKSMKDSSTIQEALTKSKRPIHKSVISRIWERNMRRAECRKDNDT